MSVTEQYVPKEYTGDAVTTEFSVPDLWFEQSDVIVLVDGNQVTWNRAATGVELTSAPAQDAEIYIYRQTTLTQDKDFVTSGRMPASEVIEAFDKQILINQEVKHTSSFLPPTTTPANRQNTTTGFDGNGDPVTRTVTEQIDHLGLTDTFADIDASATAATNAAGQAAISASAAATSATSAASSATTASNSQLAAAASATNAATSATQASNSETASASYASTAYAQANYATSQASAAATSATNAAASAAEITGNLTLTPTLTTVLTDTRVVGDLTTTGDIAVSGQPDGAGSLDLLVDDYNTDAIIRSNGYDLKLVNETSSPYFVARPSDRQIRVYGDLVVDDPTKGIILKSSGGTYYRLTVDNSGNLGTSAVTYI